MDRSPIWRWLVASMASVLVAARPAQAFLRFNDGTDQIFVTGTVATGYDSNIFASKGGAGDTTTNGSLSLEYQRRAGYIGVNASLAWNIGRFDKHTGQDFANPSASAEFTKETGRTTGSLQLNAARQSSADTAANERTTSMNYGANLNWKYPVVERFTLSGALGWSQTDYVNSPGLTNLSTYTANIDLFYVYTTERDLFGGYRIRLSDTSANTQDVDQDIHFGVNGQILPKLTGNISVGWQVRQSTGPGGVSLGQFEDLTASGSATWSYSKKLNFTGQISKDFSTTSTDITTDSLTVNLAASYAYSAKWSATANVGYGLNKFLGAAGGGRVDYDLSWGVGVNYTQSDHFKASLVYGGFENWSNAAQANYFRNTLTLTLTSRW
jgi:hypothetical protein